MSILILPTQNKPHLQNKQIQLSLINRFYPFVSNCIRLMLDNFRVVTSYVQP